MSKRRSIQFTAFLLAFTMVSLTALTGCGSTKDPSPSGEESSDNENAVVLKVADYGVTGDGVTDDGPALDTVFDMAKMKGQNDTPVVIEFEKDKSYYFMDLLGDESILNLSRY